MNKVFVAYPYSLEGYRDAIASAGNAVVELVYADETITNKHILEKITDLMKACDLCIFDLTGWNANVALELGVAIGLNLNYRVLLNAKSQTDVFSDMRGWDQLRYSDLNELQTKLDTLFRHSETFLRPKGRLTAQELDVQPYIHIDLQGGMSGPNGSYLEGSVRNVGDGIAREPTLRLPELGDVRLGGILKPEENVPLRFRYDDKNCYAERLDDLMASVEFEDRLGNLYRQEGPVTQSLTPGGTILTYQINALGLPYKIETRSILQQPTEALKREQRHKARTTTNQTITRLGMGYHANALTETHFGAQSTPKELTSTADIFDAEDDAALARIIRQLPSCGSFTVLPVTEGSIASDVEFDAQSFGYAANAIHTKTGGEITIRFGAHGAHQLYDLYRTLGSAYVLAKYLHLRYQVYPISSVTFAFTLVGDQKPDTLPKPTYQGWYEMDVSRDSLSQCATDAVVACLRAGANPRETRASVAKDLDDFWMREFSSIRIV